MLNLMFAEFVVQRTALLVYIAAAILLNVQAASAGAPLLFAPLLAMCFTFSTAAHDDRYNSHVLINSLPVTRKEVVTAKYAFHLAAGIVLITLTLLYRVASGTTPPEDAAGQLLIAAAVIGCFVSVFFPMYYWLGPRFVQIGLFLLFVAFFAAAPIVYHLGVKNHFWGIPGLLRSLPPLPLYGLLTAATLACLWVSWRASVFLYSRKEL